MQIITRKCAERTSFLDAEEGDVGVHHAEEPTPADENAVVEFDEQTGDDFDLWESLKTWCQTRLRDDKKMVTLLLVELLLRHTRKGLVTSARLAASILGSSEALIIRWRSDYVRNSGEFSNCRRGKYARVSIMINEDLEWKARKWARMNSFVRGRPNMTIADFCKFVNDDLIPNTPHLLPGFPTSISIAMGCRFLHSMGFSRKDSSVKSVYLDGHKR